MKSARVFLLEINVSWMLSMMCVQELVCITLVVLYFGFSFIQFSISPMDIFLCEWNLSTSCRRHFWLSASLGLARANFPRSSFWPIKLRGGNVTMSRVRMSHTWPTTRWKVDRVFVMCIKGLNAFFGPFYAFQVCIMALYTCVDGREEILLCL